MQLWHTTAQGRDAFLAVTAIWPARSVKLSESRRRPDAMRRLRQGGGCLPPPHPDWGGASRARCTSPGRFVDLMNNWAFLGKPGWSATPCAIDAVLGIWSPLVQCSEAGGRHSNDIFTQHLECSSLRASTGCTIS